MGGGGCEKHENDLNCVERANTGIVQGWQQFPQPPESRSSQKEWRQVKERTVSCRQSCRPVLDKPHTEIAQSFCVSEQWCDHPELLCMGTAVRRPRASLCEEQW